MGSLGQVEQTQLVGEDELVEHGAAAPARTRPAQDQPVNIKEDTGVIVPVVG
jgi:hypothetical protein